MRILITGASIKRFFFLALLLFSSVIGFSQDGSQMVRIAKIKVDPPQLEKYTQALKTQMDSAIALEPGVLFYHAVADQKDPSRITILEVYANVDAYKAHILTPHFLAYKETVKNIVKELVLEDVKTVAKAQKPFSF
jgi:quinol monooxygenase YgiN